MVKNILKIYFISGPQDFSDISIGEAKKKIIQIICSGITAFQFRDKGTIYQSNEQRIELAQELRATAKKVKVPFIVNDDVELAVLTHADGLHLGQDDEDILQARTKVGKECFIGLSVRNEQELILAQNSTADYLGIGPIYPTQSKTDAAKTIGIEELTRILRKNNLPIVGVGGIDLTKIKELKKTGINGIAVISLLTKSDDIDRTIQQIQESFV